ncbi:MAG TPA: hypothetical protein DDZ89_21585 [Clostridiales bacterium]|nr:hypothetical protein [Clostridiales bacterium]
MMKKKSTHSNTRKDRIEEIDVEHLTFSDISPRYGTGQAITHGSGRGKSYSYRNGVSTHIGDIEESIWCKIVNLLICKYGELELHKQLRTWVKDKYLWIKRDDDLTREALELHARRIFDCPEWVDYIPFNRQYRPETLENANIIRVICSCCNQAGDVTQEQINRSNGCVHCPACGRWSEFRVVS